MLGSYSIIQLALAALSTAFLDAKEEDRMAIRREALDFQALLHAHHTQAPLHAKVARSKGLEDKQGKAVTKALQSHAADGMATSSDLSREVVLAFTSEELFPISALLLADEPALLSELLSIPAAV